MFCIKNGMIHDAIHPEAYQADILVDGGKIAAIGNDLNVPEGTEMVDGWYSADRRVPEGTGKDPKTGG